MKTRLCAFLILLAFAMGAQPWNKTFDINGNSDYLNPSFVIGTSDLGSACVSWSNDNSSLPRLDYFIITKHDAAGNTVFNNRIYPTNSTTDGFTHVKAMIETRDGGFMIAGYYYRDNSYIMQPFLLKVDNGGVFQWQRWYPVNSTYFDGYQFNKISIARVEDDSDENYFIVSCADSDVNPGRDEVVNVIKVDNGGNLIWTKKYFDTSSQNYYFRNRPGGIAFSKDDKMYMITGYRLELGFTKEPRIFFFGIDRDGNVVTYFKTLEVPGRPINEDIIYDPNTKYFATTYTHDGLDPAYYNFTYSTIGLITIDAALNINLHNMYWHLEAKENYGMSITLNDDKDYVIGCHTYDGGTPASSPSLLKTDNSGNALLLMKYNVKDDVYFGYHCRTYNPNSAEEEYVLVAEHKTDLRVIRTDRNFYSCGAREYKPITKEFKYKEELFKYEPKKIGDIKKYESKVKELKPDERICTDATYDSYRPLGATGIVANTTDGSSLGVYPTLVSLANPVVTFVNNTDATLNVQVLDINGRLILSYEAATGKNSLNLGATGNLSEGIYLVKYSSGNGSLAGSKKLIISE